MSLRNFAKAGNPPTLLSAFLYFDMSFMIWVLLGPLGTFVAGDLGLSPTQKGLMAAIPLLGGSLVRIPFGLLTDRIGARKTALLGMGLTALPLLLGWLFCDSFSSVLLTGLLLGVPGASFAVALPLASRWYPPEHQGLAMGIAGAGNSGTVLTALFAPRLAQVVGWQGVFGLALIPLALVCLSFFLLAKDAPNRALKKTLAEMFAVAKTPDMLWFCLLYGVTFGGFVGLASFLSIFFFDQYGLTKIHAGDFTAICVFAGSFVRPFGGYLADRLGGVRILQVLFGVIAVLATLIAQLPPLAVVLPLLFVTMATLGTGNGTVFQLVPQRFRAEVGAATGIIGAAGGIGGFFLPNALGTLKDVTGSYGAGFTVFAGVAAVGMGVLWLVSRSWGWARVSDVAPLAAVPSED